MLLLLLLLMNTSHVFCMDDIPAEEDAGGGSDDCCLLDPRFGRKETWSMAGEILQHIAIVKPPTNIQYIEKINCI